MKSNKFELIASNIKPSTVAYVIKSQSPQPSTRDVLLTTTPCTSTPPLYALPIDTLGELLMFAAAVQLSVQQTPHHRALIAR